MEECGSPVVVIFESMKSDATCDNVSLTSLTSASLLPIPHDPRHLFTSPLTPLPRHPSSPASHHPGTPEPQHPGTQAPRRPGTPAPWHTNTPTTPPPWDPGNPTGQSPWHRITLAPRHPVTPLPITLTAHHPIAPPTYNVRSNCSGASDNV